MLRNRIVLSDDPTDPGSHEGGSVHIAQLENQGALLTPTFSTQAAKWMGFGFM